jgi:hypothetical protein
MPYQEPVSEPATSAAAPLAPQAGPAYPPIEAEEFSEEPLELPPRPRRRLLTPAPLALLGVLLIACGFIAGVLVEKSQGSPGSAAAPSGLAARFAALRGGGGGAAAAGGAGAGATLARAAAGRGTVGQVAYVSGRTLYVTTAEGNTVKVLTSPATSVQKTATASVGAIHPGETVTVTGAAGSDGSVSAEAIRVGGGAGEGLAGLFGGGAGSGRGGARGGSTAGGEPSLFGNGG